MNATTTGSIHCKRTKRDEESAQAHYTERGAGGKGGRGNGIDDGEVSEWQSDDEGEKLELVETVRVRARKSHCLARGAARGRPQRREASDAGAPR